VSAGLYLQGERGHLRDGAIATQAAIGGSDVAVAADGSLLVAAGDVWRVRLDGRLARAAGSGRDGFGGDGGPATAARVSASGVAVMADGGILLAEPENHRIRRVWPDGTISTVAGSGPFSTGDPGSFPAGAFAGDGGPATAARLFYPVDVAPHRRWGLLDRRHVEQPRSPGCARRDDHHRGRQRRPPGRPA
jgi:hypothetical protein